MAANRALIQAEADEETPEKKRCKLVAQEAEAELVDAMMRQSADKWGYSAGKSQVSSTIRGTALKQYKH